MKPNNLKQYPAHPAQKALVMSLSAIMTAMVCSSTATYASDIEIYQEARSGNISLMFVLDISGSMEDFDINGREYSSCSNAGGTSGSDSFSANSISYNKRYCSISANNYKFKRVTIDAGSAAQPEREECTGKGKNKVCTTIPAKPEVPATYAWYSCGASGSINTSDCTTLVVTAPSVTSLSATGNTNATPKYYYSSEITKNYDRITLVKDAMYQLLYGPNAIAKDKYFGLTTYSIDSDGRRGQVRIPVKRLGLSTETTLTAETHRKTLMQAVAGLSAGGGTPTAHAYAEAAAYMLGKNTIGGGYTRYFQYDREVYKCTGANNTCSSYDWTGDVPRTIVTGETCTVRVYGYNTSVSCALLPNNYYSGFPFAGSGVRNDNNTNYLMPTSLSSQLDTESDTRQCSGQGIYVLTDGVPNNNSTAEVLMKGALEGSNAFSCTDSSSGWDCVEKFNTRLLNQTTNASPRDLTLKTAVVGFGSAYNSIPSYNKNLTEAENIALLGTVGDGDNEKRAARWGIRGQGGWYAGTSAQDVIDSVNEFINNLSTEIPAVTTGTSTIPIDALNPSALQNFAYYPQFQPTPDKGYQLWAGNLKKYKVTSSGILVDKNDEIFVDAQGKILDNYDLWSADAVTGVNQDDENILGSDKNRLVGGLKSRLKLRTNADGAVQRKLLTDRAATATDGAYLSTNQLRTLDLSLVSSSDADRGYFLSLLGYRVDPRRPDTITSESLSTATELRQVGAVMHSSPVLLTNQGKISYEVPEDAEEGASPEVSSTDREDYVLFGTTQGVLHVVDAATGEEKFAFVPNTMVQSQKEAFMNFDTTIGGMDRLYYGVDGPWTSYTEYVTAADDMLTVGSGLNDQAGKQLVYGGLRMGGRNYYALDLADINNPTLKFTINPGGECSATNPLGCMGQSWSKPTITYVNWNGTKKLVMLVGGGYDAEGLPTSISSMPESTAAERVAKQAKIKHYRGYEYDDYEQTNQIGAGMYMFDALTGQLLWWTGANASGTIEGVVSTEVEDMKYSVVSQIRAVDRDSDGMSDHFYFGDLGGQVWRIDYNNSGSVRDNLRIKTPTKILNLHNGGAGSPRFYEMPAFSTYSQSGTIFAVLSLGSGNRSKPLAGYSTDSTVYDYDGVYNIYDKDVARNNLFQVQGAGVTQAYTTAALTMKTQNISLLAENETVPENSTVEQLVGISDSTRFSNTILAAPFDRTQGWYYLFKSNLVQSEKVMSTPIVINNDMFVTTFDGSRNGLSGDCGAGVKGESFMTLFCMPFGQCSTGTAATYRLNVGAGIVGGAVGAGDGSGMQRLIVTNVDTSGIGAGNMILEKRYPTGNKLIPRRWYGQH